MTITSDMRRAWGPACTGPWARLSLYGDGVVTVKALTVPAWETLSHILKKHKYKTRRADTGAYNCRFITGGKGYSLHAYGIAVDINWQSNPYGPTLVTDMPIRMIEEIEAVRTVSGARVFRWGGRYAGNKDAMHFEIICPPADIVSGIASSEVVPPVVTPPVEKPDPDPIPEEIKNLEVDMYIAVAGKGFYAQFGNVTIPLPGLSLAQFAELANADHRVGTLVIPESAATEFAMAAMLQTANATRRAN